MTLKTVSGNYKKKKGIQFHLLQDHMCSLVVNIQLTNHKGDSWRHFFAWDGRVIHDRPYNSTVNRTDRTEEGCRAVFENLLPKKEF